jgi:hypothetical protein
VDFEHVDVARLMAATHMFGGAGAPGELKAGYPLAAHPAGNGNGERGPASSASVPTAGGRNPEQQQFDEGGPKTGPRPPVAGRLRLK